MDQQVNQVSNNLSESVVVNESIKYAFLNELDVYILNYHENQIVSKLIQL